MMSFLLLASRGAASEFDGATLGVRVTTRLMGTVMGGPGHRSSRCRAADAGAGAAMVQFSRSVGAAFGTAAVAAVLFSFSQPQTARPQACSEA